MKKISATEFKAKCLSMLDTLDAEGIEITKHGKTVAKVIPIEQQSASLIGSMKGKIKKKGDIFSTGVAWNATNGKEVDA